MGAKTLSINLPEKFLCSFGSLHDLSSEGLKQFDYKLISFVVPVPIS